MDISIGTEKEKVETPEMPQAYIGIDDDNNNNNNNSSSSKTGRIFYAHHHAKPRGQFN